MRQSVAGQFFRYLFPSIAGMVSLSFYILADTYFISVGVGSAGLTALNIALPAYSAVTAIGLMLGVGAGVLVAVARGAGDREGADRAFHCALWSAVASGLLVSVAGGLLTPAITRLLGASDASAGYAAGYLRIILSCAVLFVVNNTIVALVRNDGNPGLAMLSMIANSLCNVALDYLFVLGFGWGMQGAAAATCISPAVGIGLISLHWLRRQNTLTLRRFRFNIRLLLRILRGGFSNFLLEMGNGLVIFLFNAALLGLLGDIGVAAYGIVANIALVIGNVFSGVGQGLQPVAGRCFGEGRRRDCGAVLRMALGVSLGLGLLFSALGLLFPQQLTAVFNREGNVQLAAITQAAIPLYFTGFSVMGLNICCASYFQSTLHPACAAAVSMLRSLVLVVAGILLLPGRWGVTGVWLVVPAAEAVTLLVCLLLLCRTLWEERMKKQAGDSACGVEPR